MGKPSRLVVCYTTRDGVRAELHAYADGDGSLRDNNHVDPIEESGFKGFFAVPNNRCIGAKESVAERAKTLVANGGAVFLVSHVKSGDEGFKKVFVRLVEAYSYLEGKYVVLHIEPIE